MTTVSEQPMTSAEPSRIGRRSRWLAALFGMGAILVLAAIVWIVLASRTVTSAADDRNQADLAIAAGGLEQWSAAVSGLARANFIGDQVSQLTPDERDYAERWRYRAWLRHPALGEFKIVYRVTDEAGCREIRNGISRREGQLPFVEDYNNYGSKFLKIVDSFPLLLIWQQDTRRGETGADPAALGSYLNKIVGTETGRAPPKIDDVVCFAAGIPLDRLLVIDKAARAFSTLMIVDANRRVVAQVGSERLPITSLRGLAPADSILTQSLAASLGRQPAADRPRRELADNIDPVDLGIGGRRFVAYVRPFSPPSGFDVCRAVPPSAQPARASSAGEKAETRNSSKESAAAPASEAAGECLIVALAPKATVWRQVIGLPLTIGVSLGLSLLILIAMLPSLRLILLGPGEAASRAEAIGVALGIPAVASLATLALLFAGDLVAHREAARARADAIVARAAVDAGAQIASAAEQVRLASAQMMPTEAGPGPIPTSVLPLPADPRPMFPAASFCPRRALSGVPVVDTVALFDEDGRQVVGTRPWVCRRFAGGRANISARDYFGRLRSGSAPLLDGPTGYVVSHVSALQDGISKALVATRVPVSSQARVNDRSAIARDRVFAAGTTTLTNAMAPVLPPPFGLMIVDTRSSALPVLLHPTPGRSGSETLGRRLADRDSVRDRLRALHAQEGGRTDPARFTGFYDGANRMFVARPIAGTKWVAIVHYSLADIDAFAARTVVQSLRNWAAFSIVSVTLWLLWLAVTGQRGWRRLWPQRRREADYHRLALGLAILGAATGALLVSTSAIGPLGVGSLLLAGFAARLVGGVAVHLVLARRSAGGAPTLRPSTQRRYLQMLTALLVCLSVVPMLGFWLEARQYTLSAARQDALTALLGPDGTLTANILVFDRLRWAYGLEDSAQHAARDGLLPAPGAYGVVMAEGNRLADPPTPFFSEFFASLAGEDSGGAVGGCAPSPARDVRGGAVLRLCHSDGRYGIDLAPVGWPGGPSSFLLALFAAALACGVLLLLRRVLGALAGFGVALGATDYPRLYLGDLWNKPPPRGTHLARLNRRSLLVNAPWVIFAMLRAGGVGHRIVWVDLAVADARPPAINEESIVIVTGLELVLADADRRLQVLELLEEMGRRLTSLGVRTRARLILMSETSPLERILDAFERDGIQATRVEARESLRWSRFFEDFATYNFRQAKLTRPVNCERAPDPGKCATVNTVLEECRWLSPRIVNGALGEEILIPRDEIETAIIPVRDAVYQRLYLRPLVSWSLARNFPGDNAARVHLRNLFVEHYQRIWLSSTHAEHLVMHNMAQGRFVNIGAAIAFAALVRRGIVVLDPAPRLMSKSFAMFVRQAEKLGTITAWRKASPAGAWQSARVPIFAAIGIGIAFVIGFVIISGEQLSALLPVLAAGIPAIVAAFRRAIRP